MLPPRATPFHECSFEASFDTHYFVIFELVAAPLVYAGLMWATMRLTRRFPDSFPGDGEWIRDDGQRIDQWGDCWAFFLVLVGLWAALLFVAAGIRLACHVLANAVTRLHVHRQG